MAITDLTGTKWLIYDYAYPEDNEVFNINFTSNSNSFSSMTQRMEDDQIGWVKYDNVLVCEVNGSPTWNDDYRTITITGGTDATTATLIAWFELNATQIVEGGSISVGNSSIVKSFVGTSDVSKMILNGATVYEKQAPAPTGYSGTVTNTGYIYSKIYVDRMYDSSDPDYDIGNDDPKTFSCNYFYMLDEWYQEYSVITAINCTYENVSDAPFYGYKVTPTADNWVFTASFED